MNTHDIEQERQKFEAFMREKNPSHDLEHEFGIYRFSPVQRHWDTWQAAIEADRRRGREQIYTYHAHLSHPGFGWIDPIMDAECPLIERGIAEDICVRLNQCKGVISTHTPAEPVRHPSYDSDCCQGHKSESDCRCAAYDAEPVKGPTNAQIREVFLANGFTIKPGQDDLKPYVYEAARDLLARYGQPCPHCAPVDGKYGPRVQQAWHAGWDAAQEARDATTQEQP